MADRDPERARRRILEAAAGEFAARGFAGARVDRIAADAGLNKRMLYHYFGDKRGLHEAVLDGRLGAAGVAALDPESARLLLWALLEPATAAASRERVARAGLLASGTATSVFLGALLVTLVPQASPAKPRIRLQHAPSGRGQPAPASSRKRSK